MAEHRRFGLDPADAPAQNAQAVDHRGVAVGADNGVGIGDGGAAFVFGRPHCLRQILKVDLVADAGAGGHDAEALQRRRTPAQELVPLDIAGVFEVHIVFIGGRVAEFIDHDRVIDDQVDRHQRIDLLRVAAQLGHRIAHGGQIDDAGHAGEILHQHARRAIVDFVIRLAGTQPRDQRLEIGDRDCRAIFKTQQIFEQYLHRIREPADVAELFGRSGEAVIGKALAADGERAAGVQAVLSDGGHDSVSCSCLPDDLAQGGGSGKGGMRQ